MTRWSQWVALLDHRENGTSLAVCRIIAALTVLQQLLAAVMHGVASAMWVDERFGGVRPLDRLGVLAWIGGASAGHVTALVWLGIASSALMALGLFTRATSVITWLVFRTIAGLNDESGGSGDDLLVNILFVMMFAASGRALSLDARFRPDPDARVPAWPRYVLVGQLVVMYLSTAMQKVSGGWVPWGPLDALWYILQQPTWQRFSMRWVAPFYPLTRLATLVTWCFEMGAPVLLVAFYFRATRERPGRVRAWFNRVDVRRAYLLVGLALHLGIFLTMEVGPFLQGVLALYACCIHPDEWPWRRRALRTRREAARVAP